MNSKILIVYFSWSEDTDQVARRIQSAVGGDLLRLQPQKAYPTDYYACVEQSKIELREKTRPALQPFTLDLSAYDTVFLGSPIWCGSYAPPIRSFLAEYDLSGKKVLPFCCHGGGGQRSFTADLHAEYPDIRFGETLVLRGNGGARGQAAAADWARNRV